MFYEFLYVSRSGVHAFSTACLLRKDAFYPLTEFHLFLFLFSERARTVRPEDELEITFRRSGIIVSVMVYRVRDLSLLEPLFRVAF